MFTYQEILEMSRTWTVVYFFVIFVIACVYAFWPRNREKFEHAARIPLEEDRDE